MTVADTTPVNESGGSEDLERAAAVFTDARPRLFGIAHRMPGSAVEAEDLVQEVRLRRQTCDRGAAISPAAFLATATTRLAINTVTTRLAINAVQSASPRRPPRADPPRADPPRGDTPPPCRGAGRPWPDAPPASFMILKFRGAVFEIPGHQKKISNSLNFSFRVILPWQVEEAGGSH